MEVAGRYGGVAGLALTKEGEPVARAITPERIAEWWEKIGRIKTVKGFEKMLTDVAKEQAAKTGD